MIWRPAAIRLRRIAGVLATLPLLVLAGCHITSVTGPTQGAVGHVLTYKVVIQHPVNSTLSDTAVWLMVDIPSAWSVAGSSYAGSVGGNPVSGTPATASPTAADPDGCFTDTPAQGYKRIFFSAGPFATINQFDQGTVTVRLATAGSPGTYNLAFRAATEGGPSGSRSLTCELQSQSGPPVTVTYGVSLTPPLLEVPTLNTWGIALLALLLCGFGLCRLAFPNSFLEENKKSR